ncbi:aminotransferase class V-fold PLP-dependent enzyme [Neorhodopirellula pilleata]|uniref:Isopenicillin N epimerase n=1 Tax=Neorhodopirellula pilleata TaxID=2714738 RepID=A0A5C6AAZ3_9BACT|nr:aminotransferase class V-fold PLP-dependent enzyme [Neorhodopirellula pilleata]TWT96537.1 Isopenicillin N epimerase [Neorhodopirellula pilleata]
MLSNPFRELWGLNPDVDFLNHGSFGATPISVLDAQREWMLRLESDPIEFLAPERTLLPKLDLVRRLVGSLVNASPEDIAFVRNSTEGVNAVLRSFRFTSGDEVMITNHGYNACNNAVRYAAAKAEAVVTEAIVPFPIDSETQVLDAIESKISPRTRLLLVDHVTSPTGLVFPVREIVQLAHEKGIRVMIDGAHAPGMVSVDLQDIDADYYTANHHKWLCGPKTSGFLHVRNDLQHEVRPTTISHGANTDRYGSSKFQGEFNWVGTYDPTPILALPDAIGFLSSLLDGGLPELMTRNRDLALRGRECLLQKMKTAEPAPREMIGSLATVLIPMQGSLTPSQAQSIKQKLFDDYRIEVPVFQISEQRTCLRISAQAYNCLEQYERLADAIEELLG